MGTSQNNETTKVNGAVKHDNGKARYDLIPPEALKGLAELYTLGANKYGDRNWEKGLAYSRVIAALQRHFEAWKGKEDYCPQDGQHHLLSVMWCAFALYTYQARRLGIDDRVDMAPFYPWKIKSAKELTDEYEKLILYRAMRPSDVSNPLAPQETSKELPEPLSSPLRLRKGGLDSSRGEQGS